MNRIITNSELVAVAGQDWGAMKSDYAQIKALAGAVYKQRIMREGKVPEDYSSTTYCKCCGLVLMPLSLSGGGNVLGCPWCWNKAYGWPMPK